MGRKYASSRELKGCLIEFSFTRDLERDAEYEAKTGDEDSFLD